MKTSLRQAALIVLSIVYVVCPLASSYAGDLPATSRHLDQASAIENAVGYTGFDSRSVTGASFAKRSEVSDSLDTNLSPGIPNAFSEDVWIIRFNDVELDYHTGDSAFGNFELHAATRDFDVILDGTTGRLVKVVSRYKGPKYVDGSLPWTDLKAITAPGIGHFTVGLPDKSPVEKFGAVLEWANCANPKTVQEIEAYCIYLVSTSSEDIAMPKPDDSATVWWVILRSFSGDPVLDDNGHLSGVTKPVAVYKLVDLTTNHGWTVVVSGEPILGKGRGKRFKEIAQ